MIYLAIATLLLCITALRAQHCYLLHLAKATQVKDVAKLSALLEAKIADVKALEAKVNQLLLKNGLGR